MAKVHQYFAFTLYILLIIYPISITLSTLPLYFATNVDLINRKSILQIQQIGLEKVRISQIRHHLAQKINYPKS